MRELKAVFRRYRSQPVDRVTWLDGRHILYGDLSIASMAYFHHSEVVLRNVLTPNRLHQ